MRGLPEWKTAVQAIRRAISASVCTAIADVFVRRFSLCALSLYSRSAVLLPVVCLLYRLTAVGQSAAQPLV